MWSPPHWISKKYVIEATCFSPSFLSFANLDNRTARAVKPSLIENQKEVEREYTKVIHALNESMRLSLR